MDGSKLENKINEEKINKKNIKKKILSFTFVMNKLII